MLYKAKVAVCSKNSKTECNQYVEFLYVKPGGTLNSWQALKG
jgi:hypothetical protein